MTAEPLKISLHNFYEFVWLLKTGIPRMLRILAGTEPFIHDTSILKEGYQHYTSKTRTEQIGHNTERRPEIIDNFRTYKAIVSNKIDKLAKEVENDLNQYGRSSIFLGTRQILHSFYSIGEFTIAFSSTTSIPKTGAGDDQEIYSECRT